MASAHLRSMTSDCVDLQRERIAHVLAALRSTQHGARFVELADQLGVLVALDDPMFGAASVGKSVDRIIIEMLSIHAASQHAKT
jgi:hypothetical protein